MRSASYISGTPQSSYNRNTSGNGCKSKLDNYKNHSIPRSQPWGSEPRISTVFQSLRSSGVSYQSSGDRAPSSIQLTDDSSKPGSTYRCSAAFSEFSKGPEADQAPNDGYVDLDGMFPGRQLTPRQSNVQHSQTEDNFYEEPIAQLLKANDTEQKDPTILKSHSIQSNSGPSGINIIVKRPTCPPPPPPTNLRNGSSKPLSEGHNGDMQTQAWQNSLSPSEKNSVKTVRLSEQESRPKLPLRPEKEKNGGLLRQLGRKIINLLEACGGGFVGLLEEEESVRLDDFEKRCQKQCQKEIKVTYLNGNILSRSDKKFDSVIEQICASSKVSAEKKEFYHNEKKQRLLHKKPYQPHS